MALVVAASSEKGSSKSAVTTFPAALGTPSGVSLYTAHTIQASLVEKVTGRVRTADANLFIRLYPLDSPSNPLTPHRIPAYLSLEDVIQPFKLSHGGCLGDGHRNFFA